MTAAMMAIGAGGSGTVALRLAGGDDHVERGGGGRGAGARRRGRARAARGEAPGMVLENSGEGVVLVDSGVGQANSAVVIVCISAAAQRALERVEAAEEALRRARAAARGRRDWWSVNGHGGHPLGGAEWNGARAEAAFAVARARALSATPGLLRMVATRDPYDRAHAQRDSAGLVPAARGRGMDAKVVVTSSRARRYPLCCTVGRAGMEVGVDSAMDDLFERQQWLRSQGVELGTGNVAEANRALLDRIGDEVKVRDLVTRRATRQRDEVTGVWVR